MNRDQRDRSDPDQQARDRLLIRLLQKHYPVFGMYAWHGYHLYGRGALILDPDAPMPQCLYVSLEQTRAIELPADLVALMAGYDPQTSIVVSMWPENLGCIWLAQPPPPECAGVVGLGRHSSQRDD